MNPPLNKRKLKFTIAKRDNGLCRIQGSGCTEKGTELHHIVPRSNPNPWLWDEKNLCLACNYCHVKYGQWASTRSRLIRELSKEFGYDYSVPPFSSYVDN